MVSSPFQYLLRRRPRLLVVGPLLLASALAAGCSASSATPAPASSASSGSGSQASFRQCLQKQGVSLPQGRPSVGNRQPRTRPTGSAASAFRKAVVACGGGSFPPGGNATG
jgi:hypothetical protein